MMNLKIGDLIDESVEMTERKGIGHPDTICDYVVDEISKALCRYYLEKFDRILHHNIDKALLIGGNSSVEFGGGKIDQPIRLIIAGRATNEFNNSRIPVEDIANTAAREWLLKNLRFLAIEDIEIDIQIRPGSEELTELFKRSGDAVPLSNDTSFGCGFYPLTDLQSTVIRIERVLNSSLIKDLHPFVGEDIKVMGVMENGTPSFTVSIAIVSKFVGNIEEYITAINKVKNYLLEQFGLNSDQLHINTADNYEAESVYLTVSGTSAECGDDGQVGRGNRINGLITPYFPMSLEAVCGKNPVSHVGKIYNYFAQDLSKQIVQSGVADQAQVFIVSQIGKPIDEPQLIHLRLNDKNVNEDQLEIIVQKALSELPMYWKRILNV